LQLLLQGEVVLSEFVLLVSDLIAVVVAGRSCSVRVWIISFRYDCNCCFQGEVVLSEFGLLVLDMIAIVVFREKLFCQSLDY